MQALTFTPKHALPAAGPALACPDCSEPMVRYGGNGCTLEKCPRCHGIWFGGRGLGSLKDALDRFDFSALHGLETSRDVEAISACPRCERALGPFRYGYNTSVVLGRCARCRGTWLPLGQLMNLIALSKLGKDLAPHLAAVAKEWRDAGEARERGDRVFAVVEFLKRSVSLFR